MEYEIHRYANVFPMMGEEEFNKLKDDIKENGLLQPIYIYENKILDGRNRLKACKETNVNPKFEKYEGNSPLQFVISLNLKRRHLTPSQSAAIAVLNEELINEMQEEAKKRQGTRTDLFNNISPQMDTSNVGKGRVTETLGKAFNVGKTYIAEAKKLKEENQEKLQEILLGVKTITQAKREIKEEKREKERQEDTERIQTIKSPEEIFKNIKFTTVVIDPPWDWGDEGDINQLGRAKPDYNTISFEDLKKLPINKLTKDDSHIYLWITNRSLPKGFELLKEWGFRYITCLTWCKPSIGMGNYFRGSTEQILFGVKGSLPLKRKDVGTWFQAQRGNNGHSSKPIEMYEIVENCSPGLYLDYFGREKREGWEVYGNETNKF